MRPGSLVRRRSKEVHMRYSNPISRIFPRVLVAGLSALALLASLPSALAAGPNLAPNSSFEQSVLEPFPVPPYTMYQPVLPTGWAFEGAAGLFDHTAYYCIAGQPLLCGGNGAHSGTRSAAISAPLGGKRRYCVETSLCVENPANGPKDSSAHLYTLNPHWRTAEVIPVSPNTAYSLRVWTYLANVTVGEGVITSIRWYSSSVPVGISSGESRRVTSVFQTVLDWGKICGSVTSPPNANGAVILLGHSDDTWTGHIRFDDVFFGTGSCQEL